jgi:hypothetical protein
MTRVINIATGEPYNVYIGRQRPAFMWSGGYHLPRSIWSNPFKVGSREEVIGNYERWLLTESLFGKGEG